MTSFQAQQARWAKGLIQTAKKVLPVLLRSDLPLKVKAEACFHLTANISYPLMVVLSILLLPAIVVRYYHWSGQLLYLDIPLFLGTFSSLSTFYVLSQKELYPRQWRRAFLMLPALMAVGIGLTLTNARAVMEALLGIASPFQRTAKYSTDQSRVRLARGKYRVRGGLAAYCSPGGRKLLWFLHSVLPADRQLGDDAFSGGFRDGLLLHRCFDAGAIASEPAQ